ncbi:hypothetical protein SAMN05428942_6792 [Streptomyces sp. 2112.2]|nr:hypothetical protein SAMN05428942_6792 [Streptomyces sp. 2112.2]
MPAPSPSAAPSCPSSPASAPFPRIPRIRRVRRSRRRGAGVLAGGFGLAVAGLGIWAS